MKLHPVGAVDRVNGGEEIAAGKGVSQHFELYWSVSMAKLWSKPERVSSWRKISVGMWKAPSDPTIYGFETMDVDELLDYLEEVSLASGKKVTITAYLAKCCADIIGENPALNAIVVANRVLRRENVDIFCQVAVANKDGGSADLSGVKIANADGADLVDIADRLHSRADKVRKGQDEEIEQTKSMIDKIPPLLLPKMMRIFDILTYAVPLDLGKIGIRNDPFGSLMVTNCAPFGIRLGFAPLVPSARTPMVILPGIVEDHLFVENGEPVVKRGCQMSMTFDHRCFDGLQIGIFVREFRARIGRPRDYYPDPETYGSLEEKGGVESSKDRTPPTPESSKLPGS